MFKIIDKNIDHIINKEYHLCKINLADLITFVREKLGDIDFEQFNRRYTKFDIDDYYEIDNEPDENKEIRKNRVQSAWYETSEEAKARRENDEYYYKRHDYLSDKERKIQSENVQKFIFENSTENNFISLYSENFDGENFDGKFYLLDGYRRLLFDFDFFEKNTNKDVYVKIYTKSTTDQDIMKLMFNFNMWKIPQGIHEWFDRGWRLFIYMRLGIKFSREYFYHLDKYIGDYYTRNRDYTYQEKIITSKQFYNDLKTIDYLVNSDKMQYRQGTDFNYIFIEKLSKERLDGNTNDLNIEDWMHYLELHSDDVNKINSMSVHGHYVKRISILVNEFFEVWKNPSLIEEMKKEKPKAIIKTTLEEYYFKIPRHIINEHNISIINENTLHFDGVWYQYEHNKLYQAVEGIQGIPRVRVYLFFDNYHLIKYDDFYYILTNDAKPCLNTMYHYHNNDKVLIRGTKEEIIAKVKELTFKEWKPNTRKTEFL